MATRPTRYYGAVMETVGLLSMFLTMWRDVTASLDIYPFYDKFAGPPPQKKRYSKFEMK